jgi:hypothetical protein
VVFALLEIFASTREKAVLCTLGNTANFKNEQQVQFQYLW